MTGFFSRKPLTRQQLAAVHAKKRIGILKDNQRVIENNRKAVEDQIRRNNSGELSPQEQSVVVTASRSAKIEKGDLSDLAGGGDRNEQTAIVLNKQREKLLQQEQNLEFQKNKLDLARKEN